MKGIGVVVGTGGTRKGMERKMQSIGSIGDALRVHLEEVKKIEEGN